METSSHQWEPATLCGISKNNSRTRLLLPWPKGGSLRMIPSKPLHVFYGSDSISVVRVVHVACDGNGTYDSGPVGLGTQWDPHGRAESPRGLHFP